MHITGQTGKCLAHGPHGQVEALDSRLQWGRPHKDRDFRAMPRAVKLQYLVNANLAAFLAYSFQITFFLLKMFFYSRFDQASPLISFPCDDDDEEGIQFELSIYVAPPNPLPLSHSHLFLIHRPM